MANPFEGFTDWNFDEVVEDEYEDFSVVEEPSIGGQGRWNTYWGCVVLYKPNNTYWRLEWVRGSTENQDCDPYYEFHQVRPVQRTVTVYERIG